MEPTPKSPWRDPKPGELLWQRRMPGGICILLDECEVQEGPRSELYYRVLHPTEGLIQDAAYYYIHLDDA
jgi:hypothetical protein